MHTKLVTIECPPTFPDMIVDWILGRECYERGTTRYCFDITICGDKLCKVNCETHQVIGWVRISNFLKNSQQYAIYTKEYHGGNKPAFVAELYENAVVNKYTIHELGIVNEERKEMFVKSLENAYNNYKNLLTT
jgi:hypothetical protein